jgi:hypothetical protein
VEVILCDRALMVCPHPGLGLGGAAYRCPARAGRARGRGRPRQPGAPLAVDAEARAGVPSPGKAPGERASAPRSVHRRRARSQTGGAIAAHPRGGPVRREAAPPCARGPEDPGPLSGGLAREQVTDRARQLRSQEGQPWAVLRGARQAGRKPLAVGGVTPDQGGRFRNGPLAVGVTAVLAGRPPAVAGGGVRPVDAARV